MATTNEEIRDLLIKHQVALIRGAEDKADQIVALLAAAHKDLRERIDKRLAKIVEEGFDPGPTTTARLLKIEDEIRGILNRPHREIDAELRQYLGDTARSSARFTKDLFADKVVAVVNFGLPAVGVLKEIVDHNPIEGGVLKDWLAKLERDDVERAMAAIRIGLVQGEGVRQIVARVRKGGEITRRAAEMLVRTVANGVFNQARQRFFEANAKYLKEVVWISTLDSRTCPRCGWLDGRRYPVDSGPRPPEHPSCRCTVAPAIDGRLFGNRPLKRSTEEDLLREYAEREGIDPVKRRASLPRGHKGKFDKFSRKRVRELTGQTPASTTFEEFLEKQSPAFQDKVLRREVADWYRKGKLKLRDLFDQNGDIYSIDDLLRRHPDLSRNERRAA